MARVFGEKRLSPRPIQLQPKSTLPYLRIEAQTNLLVSVVRTFPVTLALLLVLTAAGIVTGAIGRGHFQTVLDTIGFDLEVLKHGKLYVMPLGPLVQDRPGFPWQVILLIFVVGAFVGSLEYLARSWRTAITYFVSDFVSTIASTLLLWGLAASGSARANEYIHTPDLGASSAAFGCAAAFAAMLPGWWRALVAGAFAAYLLPSLVIVRHVFALEHLIAALIGFTLGLWWQRQTASGSARRAGKVGAV